MTLEEFCLKWRVTLQDAEIYARILRAVVDADPCTRQKDPWDPRVYTA